MIKNLFRPRGLSVLLGALTAIIMIGIVQFQLPEAARRQGRTYVVLALIEVGLFYGGLVATNLILSIRDNHHRRRTGS